ncbi:MAG: tetratricopeptide repeat protein [Gallionella sp.]|nr:tetratricopeptide repeat protein [Gallionella sp.]
MSVINQVLNQLEQRGAHGAPEQTMVRAVPSIKRKSAMPLLMLGLVLAIGVAVWQWIQSRKPDVVAMSVAQYRPSVIAAVAPASAVPPHAVSNAIEEPQVVEMLLPASRLSFELSSIPLPSSLRESKNSVAPGGVEGLAASSASADHRQDSAKVIPAAGAPAKSNRKSGMPPPAQVASTDEKTAVQPSGDTLPLKQISPAQHADAEFRKAVALMQQGRIADALAGYEAALRLDAGHDAARQALVALLLEGKRGAEAERVLQDGLGVKPERTGFAMLLARLQVERGAVELATATLEKTLIQAERQADYHAFFAALLQRQNRQKEAITHYQIALQLVPDNGIWLMGYGISLQAAQRTDDARDAYRRALESQTLSPELRAFVQMKIKEL